MHYWPPTATSWLDADPDWAHEVLVRYFERDHRVTTSGLTCDDEPVMRHGIA